MHHCDDGEQRQSTGQDDTYTMCLNRICVILLIFFFCLLFTCSVWLSSLRLVIVFMSVYCIFVYIEWRNDDMRTWRALWARTGLSLMWQCLLSQNTNDLNLPNLFVHIPNVRIKIQKKKNDQKREMWRIHQLSICEVLTKKKCLRCV